MSTKASRPEPARQTLPGNAPLPNFLSDVGREQFAVFIEAAGNWFRSREAMRRVQQEMAHQALVVHESAAQKLRHSAAPADLLDVHAELLRFYLQSPSHYWEQVAKTSLYTHIEMMAGLNHLFVGRTGDGMRWALNRFQAALPANEAALDAIEEAADGATPAPVSGIRLGDSALSQMAESPLSTKKPIYQ